ncbi:hypothetical protein FQN54_002824 [Arachnomyces sp. PD_36]|nr:hypothetical protein FQN54_002824 [Arachnomyces sp. PD_36]
MLSSTSSTLPYEITLHVAQYVKSTDDRRNLALCSRALCDMVLPLVYENFTLYGQGLNNIIRWVETFLSKPRLASWVRSLTLQCWNTTANYEWHNWQDMFREEDPEPPLPSPDDGLKFDKELVRDAVKSLSSPHDEKAEAAWMADILAGNEDAWIALILFSLPNIESLHITSPGFVRHPFVVLDKAAKREPPFDTRPAFTHLTDLTVEWWDTETGLDAKDLLPFYSFPSLRSVTGHMITEGYEGEDSHNYQPIPKPTTPTSSVTELAFTESNACHGMQSQIQLCKNLKSFRYEHADGGTTGEGFQPQKFAQSLSSAKHSLESLYLDYHDSHYPIGHDNEDEVFGPSLAEFTRLKTIHLRLNNLSGIPHGLNEDPYNSLRLQDLADVLPKSLENLRVTDIDASAYSHFILELAEFLEENFNVVPNLKTLVIEGYGLSERDAPAPVVDGTRRRGMKRRKPHLRPEVLEDAEGARKACEAVGVKFELTDAAIINYYRYWD